jgi:hypothetical protein
VFVVPVPEDVDVVLYMCIRVCIVLFLCWLVVNEKRQARAASRVVHDTLSPLRPLLQHRSPVTGVSLIYDCSYLGQRRHCTATSLTIGARTL